MKFNTAIGISLGLLTLLASMPANADEFSSNGAPSGHTTAGGIPGSANYGTDKQCGGTDRAYYNNLYGTQAVVLSTEQAKQIYDATNGAAFFRCGSCGEQAICWPTQQYEAVFAQSSNNNGYIPGNATQDVFNSGTSGEGYYSPGYGKYTPGTTIPQQTKSNQTRRQQIKAKILNRIAKNTPNSPISFKAVGEYSGYPLTAYFDSKTPKDQKFNINLKNYNQPGVPTPFPWATGYWSSESGEFVFTSVAINPQFRSVFGGQRVVNINVHAKVVRQ
jgi:hypothetical protein